jgi:hypothetical protein
LLRLYQVLELLIRAKFSRERVALLQDGNLELELLRFQFRIAKDLKCLSLESYGYAARELNEIGKLVGGWIKASQSRKNWVLSKTGRDRASEAMYREAVVQHSPGSRVCERTLGKRNG